MKVEQARKFKIGVLLTVITVTMIVLIPSFESCFFFVRAYSPFPVNYLARLNMLDHWDTERGHGLNYSGFISNAHSEKFHLSSDFYLQHIRRSHPDRRSRQPVPDQRIAPVLRRCGGV